MTRDQIIREEFERWQSDDGKRLDLLDRSLGYPENYRYASVIANWHAWKAAWAVAEGYSA